MAGQFAVVDQSWELIDPNPDIHQLFSQFNETFFWGKLSSVYVQWSPRMTLCAGVCKYHGRNRECSIHLSKPLLSYRPRKDLVETLLHEMIHAYLFVADNDRERESHGPKFHEHMYRINRLTGANITVYHSFHDEVALFKTHWWKCDGPCQHRAPYFGTVKRSMNRAPGPSDFWFKDHQSSCGGKFIKIKEPPPKKPVKRKKEGKSSQSQESSQATSSEVGNENKNKITNYFTSPTSNSSGTVSSQPSFGSPPSAAATTSNVETFSGRGFVLGSIGNNPSSATSQLPKKLFNSSSITAPSSSLGSLLGVGSQSKPPTRGEHPLLAKWLQNHKDAPKQPTKKPKPSATVTRPTSSHSNPNWLDEFLFPQSSSSSKGSNKMNHPPVEVIDID